jgi:ATP-dependent Lon protease
MTLQEKIMEAFIGKVVRKDLAFLVKGNLPVPTYVLEYLLGQYCASDDEAIIEEGLTKVKDVIRTNYVHRAEAEEVKGKIRESGRFRIIDKISVTLNERADEYQAQFANLSLTGVPISAEVVKKNPKLLSGNGVWCIVTIGYIGGEDIKVRWDIQNLKPIQISNIDVEEYIEQREKFTTDEWIDFLIHTVGLNPDILNRREKFIVLSRLLPHVENNFNFMELGPKGTGKSHVFQELSPYGVLVSGGDVTSARLFVKMSGNREILGLVGYWDVVAWDEYEQQKGKSIDSVLIDTMQNYLANKSFNRGKNTHEATASMSFVGNTKHTVPYMLKNSHLFESIPTAFIKGAFLDRIHLYNPGWEIKMLKKDSFSKGYGLITDYIAAVLHALRNRDYSYMLKDYAKFDGSLTERDHLAIRKTFSGLVKLLYPNGKFTDEEAIELVDFAAESRKRVKDQLYIIDETIRAEPVNFKYTNLKTGEERQVETLERIENGITGLSVAVPGEANPEDVAIDIPDPSNDSTAASTAQPADVADGKERTTVAQSAEQSGRPTRNSVSNHARPRIPNLQPHQLSVRLNQRGVTYKSLFGDYVRDAKFIRVTDPFIRHRFQIDNFVDFVQMVRECSNEPEEVKLHLSTNNEDDKVPEMIDIFDELANELASYGITFTYDFKANHDRSIQLDNGWNITLGRGLDIYEKFSPFTVARADQASRRCREFTITYIKK